jgi:glutaminyl-peptide cyclotransferase
MIVVLVTTSILALALNSTTVSATQTLNFSGDKAYTHVQSQIALGNRIPNTTAHQNCVSYIASTMKTLGLSVSYQNFTGAQGEGAGVPFVNIIGVLRANQTAEKRVLLAAHYDTRPFSDHDITGSPKTPDYAHPVPGANDGASGVAVLLEMARAIKPYNRTRDIYFLFLDGEDYGTDLQSSMLYGSRYYASKMTQSEISTTDYFILFDMVGDKELNIYREQNSDISLQDKIFSKAASLGITQFHNDTRYQISDDHIPFRDHGIKVVDLIDFDYINDTVNYWHTPMDTLDKVSAASLGATGRVVEGFLVDDIVYHPPVNNTTPPPPPKPKPCCDKRFIPGFETVILVVTVVMAVVISTKKKF